MNVELVAQMFKNYRSNVLFHLEGKKAYHLSDCMVQELISVLSIATDSLQDPSELSTTL